MKKPEAKSIIPFYALVVWIYPVLAFVAANLGQANPIAAIRPGMLSLLLGLITFGVNYVWLRSSHRAAVMTAIWALLFSSYGHIYLKLENAAFGGILLGRHRYLLLIWAVLWLISIWLVRKIPKQINTTTSILNNISILLSLMPLVQGAYYYINQNGSTGVAQSESTRSVVNLTDDKQKPDIYFIVLDAYGREDLLESVYRYDNSGFIEFLKEKGFYIAGCSQSNYNHTWFSITTTLNMDYLENLGRDGEPARPVPLIKHSVLRETLEEAGYQTVAFETGYDFIDITDADYYFYQNSSRNFGSIWLAPINAFELMYLRTTLVTAILELNGISEDEVERTVKKDMMDFIYDNLMTVPQIEGPKFVYAHINTTHPPFFYSLDDQQRAKEEEIDHGLADLGAQTRLYRESIMYSNERMTEVISSILEQSKTPPIIILEGDHGPFLSNTKERIFNILNAYCFPDKNYDQLYPSISPVNSFRVILNRYYNADYQLLDDRSEYSDSKDTWNFVEVPNNCVKGE